MIMSFIKKSTALLLSMVIIISCVLPLGVTTANAVNTVTTVDDKERDVVLILDTSGSMGGGLFSSTASPLANVKTAANSFIAKTLEKTSNTNISLVTYSSSAIKQCDFTKDASVLADKINSLYASGGTNMESALNMADSILSSSVRPAAIKAIVFMTDGYPEGGSIYNGTDARYSTSEYGKFAPNASAVYNTAVPLKNKYGIYTLGFFHSLTGTELKLGRQLLKDIASDPKNYYDVVDPKDLEFAFGEIYNSLVGVQGRFSYSVGHIEGKKGQMAETEFMYYDNMFTHPASRYDHDLATMSLSVAMAAFGKPRQRLQTTITDDNGTLITTTGDHYNRTNEEHAGNIRTLLGNATDDKNNPGLGFQHVRNVNYAPTPTIDSIAATFAYKEIDDENGEKCKLILIAVRGGEYTSEWGGNFRIGSGDIHEGFEIAKNTIVNDYFKSYIKDLKLERETNVKLWITGYSRAAAVSNLIANEFDDETKNSKFFVGEKNRLETKWKITKDDIYAYCFATPNNSKKKINGQPIQGDSDPKKEKFKETHYPNIFNIMNPNDFVPKVAPYEWGYDKYGYSLWLPAYGDEYNKLSNTPELYAELEEKMINEFSRLNENIDTYKINSFQIHEGRASIPASAVIGGSVGGVVGAAMFIKLDIYDKGPFDFNLRLNKFQDKVLYPVISKNLFKSSENYEQKLQQKVIDEFEKFGKDGDIEPEKILGSMVFEIIDTSFSSPAMISSLITAQDFKLWDLKTVARIRTDDKKIKAKGSTVAKSQEEVETNLKALIQGHYPDLYLAWMRALPADYFGGVPRRNPVDYRTVYINCPINAEILDEKGKVVGKIINDVPTNLENTGVTVAFDENGQKVIYLPANSKYTIKMTATDSGSMTYTVSEFARERGGNTRVINYYDIPLKNGETFECNVSPINDDGSKASYVLRDSKGIIQPDEDLEGDKIREYTVEIEVEGNGFAVGSGVRYVGTFAKVTATPGEKETFDGWYNKKDDSLISKDTEHRFRVEEDIVLTAKFSGETIKPIDAKQDNSTDGFPTWAIILISLVGVMLVAGIVILVVFLGLNNSKSESESYDIPLRKEEGQELNIDEQKPVINNFYSQEKSNAGSITVVSGSMAGSEIAVKHGETLIIGKDKNIANLVLSEDYQHVSRVHCTVSFDLPSDKYFVTDSSSNGTYYSSGIRMVKGSRTPVKRGTVIKLGDDNCKIKLN